LGRSLLCTSSTSSSLFSPRLLLASVTSTSSACHSTSCCSWMPKMFSLLASGSPGEVFWSQDCLQEINGN
jgi:hypothetical protein